MLLEAKNRDTIPKIKDWQKQQHSHLDNSTILPCVDNSATCRAINTAAHRRRPIGDGESESVSVSVSESESKLA